VTDDQAAVVVTHHFETEIDTDRVDEPASVTLDEVGAGGSIW